MKKLLIVICSYNSKEYTRRIYEELKDIKNFDLLLLDNSNKAEEIKWINRYPELKKYFT